MDNFSINIIRNKPTPISPNQMQKGRFVAHRNVLCTRQTKAIATNKDFVIKKIVPINGNDLKDY